MKFATTLFLAFLSFATTASAGEERGECYMGSIAAERDCSTDFVALESCSATLMKRNRWLSDDAGDEAYCGGRKWFIGAKDWNSPKECMTHCAHCIGEGIREGRTSGTCVVRRGVMPGTCWFGYQ